MSAPSSPSVLQAIEDSLQKGLTRQDPTGQWNAEALADRVQEALEDLQPDHQIDLTEEGWVMQHSMACRLEGRLLDCKVNAAARAHFAEAPPAEIGWRFVVEVEGGELEFLARVCKRCGCTDVRACPGGCSWVGPSICSRCTT